MTDLTARAEQAIKLLMEDELGFHSVGEVASAAEYQDGAQAVRDLLALVQEQAQQIATLTENQTTVEEVESHYFKRLLAAEAQLATLTRELALLRDAAQDTSLSDAALRTMVMGLQEPTADDIAWARSTLMPLPEPPR